MRLRFEHGRRDELKTLHPAYFAMVMATGIVSIAAHLHGVPVVPTVLVWLNALFLAALGWRRPVARILRYPRDVCRRSSKATAAASASSPSVAATRRVRDAACPVAATQARLAAVFWTAAAILWAVMTYGELAVLTVKPDKPSLG